MKARNSSSTDPPSDEKLKGPHGYGLGCSPLDSNTGRFLDTSLGRPLGYFIFSLTGFKRAIYRNIFQRVERAIQNNSPK